MKPTAKREHLEPFSRCWRCTWCWRLLLGTEVSVSSTQKNAHLPWAGYLILQALSSKYSILCCSPLSVSISSLPALKRFQKPLPPQPEFTRSLIESLKLNPRTMLFNRHRLQASLSSKMYLSRIRSAKISWFLTDCPSHSIAGTLP